MVDRLMPLLVLLAVMLGAAFMPAMAVVQTREEGTLTATLATPLTPAELLFANGILGMGVALFCAALVVLLNGAQLVPAVAASLVLAAAMCAAIGLAVACVVRQAETMMAVWKIGGLALMFPAILWLEPSMPEWLAKLGPTYYFLQPLHAASQEGASFSELAGTLGIGVVITVGFVGLVVRLAPRLRRG
jgi:ABC-2 type transport system permease protein